MTTTNFSEEQLKTVTERAEYLINEINTDNETINSSIKNMKGNFFIYKEIMNNILLLEKANKSSDFKIDDQTRNLINEINEKFILENIEREIENLYQNSINSDKQNKTSTSYFRNLLMDMISSMDKLQDEKDEKVLGFNLLSNLIYLVEMLKEMNQVIKSKLRKKCENCSDNK